MISRITKYALKIDRHKSTRNELYTENLTWGRLKFTFIIDLQIFICSWTRVSEQNIGSRYTTLVLALTCVPYSLNGRPAITVGVLTSPGRTDVQVTPAVVSVRHVDRLSLGTS